MTKKNEPSILSLLLFYILCVGAAGFVAIIFRGLELLDLPAWAWAYAALTTGGIIILYALNVRNGRRDDVAHITGSAALGIVGLLGLAFALGLNSDTPPSDTPAQADVAQALGFLISDMGQVLARLSLLVIPTVVLGVNAYAWSRSTHRD